MNSLTSFLREIFMQVGDGLMQMHIDGLFTDTQLCRNLLILQMTVVAQQKHPSGLRRQLRIDEMTNFRITLFLCRLRDLDNVIRWQQPFNPMAHLTMGKDIHALISDCIDQIRFHLVLLRQTGSLHQSGKDVTDGILALFCIM